MRHLLPGNGEIVFQAEWGEIYKQLADPYTQVQAALALKGIRDLTMEGRAEPDSGHIHNRGHEGMMSMGLGDYTQLNGGQQWMKRRMWLPKPTVSHGVLNK